MNNVCSICNKDEVWIAAVIDPKNNVHIYDALCGDCYTGIEMERRNVVNKIKDELENGWLRKIINLPK